MDMSQQFLKDKHYTRGLTLIETVLYMALLSILFSVALPLLMNLNTWQSKQKNFADSVRDYVFIEAKIRGLLKDSSVVTPPLGQVGSVLRVRAGNGHEATVWLNENGTGVLELEEWGQESLRLFATRTKVESLKFFRTESNGVESLLFGIIINGINFGTSTYFLGPN